jgi:phosphatidate cytidylyltransferase
VDEPAGPVVPGDASQPGGPASPAAPPEDLETPAAEPGGGPASPAPQPDGLETPAAEPRGAGGPAPQPEVPGSPASQPGGPGSPAPRSRTGRNLPAALGVGLGLGGLALVTLFTVKATFLLYVGAALVVALWELSRAFGTRSIHAPVLPVAAGGAAAIGLAYFEGERALVACLALTTIAVLAWRLPGGVTGYLRDVTAGVFALGYLPLPASFVALMLAAPDGARRVLIFVLLPVCADIGGYFAGISVGRHLMAPGISPKKTWEGLGGSALACLAAGAIAVPALLHGTFWQGLLVGAAALAAATLGDLTESMIKRDLEIKDMGTVLPGHGGVLDRVDSLVVSAPVVWLLLLVFVPVAGHS